MRKGQSLKQKIFVMFLMLNGVLLSLGFSFAYYIQQKDLKNDLQNQLQIISSQLVSSTQAAIAFRDLELTQQEINRLKVLSFIDSVHFYLPDHTHFAGFGETPTMIPNRIEFEQLDQSEAHWTLWKPLTFQNEYEGFLYIQVSTMDLVKRSQRTISSFIFAILVVLMVSVIFALIIQRQISRPVEKMAEMAETVTKEDRYDLRIPDIEIKEFEELVLAMNRMLEQVEWRQNQRDQAEKALRKSETRFRSTFEHAAVGLAHISSNKKIIWANQKMSDILCVPSNELLNSPIEYYLKDQEGWLEKLDNLISGNSNLVTDISEHVNAHKLAFWGKKSASRVTNSNGKTEYLILVLEDITHSRKLEEELNHARKMDSLGRLAGGVAHDFNNILTVIQGYCDLIQAQNPNQDIQPIQDATERAMALTQQLLAFGRKQVMKVKPTSVNKLLKNLEKMLHRLIREDIQFVMHLDQDAGWVKCDPNQLEQVLINLVVNARDAMPQGGTLSVKSFSGKRWKEESPWQGAKQDFVVIEVTDSGIGMSPEILERVFEPFFTTKEEGKGTGLGLASAHGIIQQFGGTIVAKSTLKVGSKFQIFLEQTQAQSKTIAPEKKTAFKKGKGQTILIVEDQHELREMLQKTFEIAGYKPHTATNGRQALDQLKQHNFDLIVSDMVMPEMNGFELYQELVKIKYAGSILFISGYPDDKNFLKLIREENIPYLGKPFTSKALLEKVGELLYIPTHSE